MDIWAHINFKRATRENRENAAIWMLDHPQALPYLINTLDDATAHTAQKEDALRVKTAYILEMMAVKDLSSLTPELTHIARLLPHLNSDSIQRALLHIMTLWLAPLESLDSLDSEVIEILTEHCFDKLIKKPEAAVAVQAHAMSCLYYLSRANSWIKEPLADIIIKQMPGNSPGYQARGRQILKWLNQE
jgi:hypothetical protein